MHPQIESVFDEAERRYLKSEELGVIGQYVDSLPERLALYRQLRDSEIDLMQRVADQLQTEVGNQPEVLMERSIKSAILVLRYSALGMLLNDETLVKDRLISWLKDTAAAYTSETVDATLYRLLNQKLNQTLSSQQMQLLKPMLALAQETLVGQVEANSPAAIGW
jgi:hypothetical protein